MTSIKIKFRPSSVEGKEGRIYFLIIHNRVVRQLNMAYKIFASEWDEETETIIANSDRTNIVNAIKKRMAWDNTRLEKVRWLLTWVFCPVLFLFFFALGFFLFTSVIVMIICKWFLGFCHVICFYTLGYHYSLYTFVGLHNFTFLYHFNNEKERLHVIRVCRTK